MLPFHTQALIKLGQIVDPFTKEEKINLELAKRLIDLLELLKKKTQGNLDTEEEELLNQSLHQLKSLYLEKTKASPS
ncbi:MAG: DUF1844 domain-containing protein [Candidatus Aminicenantes bacterium]|nr:DUF1844 domain-containing protein [Candidatus Aminicenantes bacterium]